MWTFFLTLLSLIPMLHCAMGTAPHGRFIDEKMRVRQLFHRLLNDGIRAGSARPNAQKLAFVLQSLQKVDWVSLVREVDVILDEDEKRDVKREIQHYAANMNNREEFPEHYPVKFSLAFSMLESIIICARKCTDGEFDKMIYFVAYKVLQPIQVSVMRGAARHSEVIYFMDTMFEAMSVWQRGREESSSSDRDDWSLDFSDSTST